MSLPPGAVVGNDDVAEATGLYDPDHLADDLRRIVDVLQHIRGENHVEMRVREGIASADAALDEALVKPDGS